jgi:hypothetical protein
MKMCVRRRLSLNVEMRGMLPYDLFTALEMFVVIASVLTVSWTYHSCIQQKLVLQEVVR